MTQARSAADSPLPLHIGSHLGLLDVPYTPLPADSPHRLPALDAVIVPAHRAQAHLPEVADIARLLRCPLLVLCSDDLAAGAALAQLGAQSQVMAVDVGPALASGRLLQPQLVTDRPRHLVGRGDVRHGDVGIKRNLGVLLARAMGWRAILFLDDDIRRFDLAHATRALELLNTTGVNGPTSAVGWSCRKFEDNSVVCHAHRRAGGKQDVFIGGGGLAVRVDEQTPFFPNVYNEDWLFLFPLLARRGVLRAGELGQDRFDPYDPARMMADHQEFGDVLAEGMFRLLHTPGLSGASGLNWEAVLDLGRDELWWGEVLKRRDEWLGAVSAALCSASRKQKKSNRGALASVAAARRRLAQFSRTDFATYVGLWCQDLETWRNSLAEIQAPYPRPFQELGQALKQYGLDEDCWATPPAG